MGVTVLLARHGSHAEVGRVLSGRSEIALDERGHGEAAWLAERLSGHGLASVQSSPRRRARETAEPVAKSLGLPVEMADALDEIDFGEWAAKTFEALDGDPEWRRWNEERSRARPPGGETMAEASTRAVSHIETLAAGGDGAAHLCVSHCDVIRGVVAHYLGLSADRLLAFDIAPGSISELEVWPGGGRVVGLNERPR